MENGTGGKPTESDEKDFGKALGDIGAILSGKASRDAVLQELCGYLSSRFPPYGWVGFYIAEPGARELVLGPFVGEPTEHVRIPFGRGICGQAAEREETFVVPDVALESNYLSCSPRVRSEIVIPVFAQGTVAAELDIDSHVPDAFSPRDREFLERVALLVSPLFAKS